MENVFCQKLCYLSKTNFENVLFTKAIISKCPFHESQNMKITFSPQREFKMASFRTDNDVFTKDGLENIVLPKTQSTMERRNLKIYFVRI